MKIELDGDTALVLFEWLSRESERVHVLHPAERTVLYTLEGALETQLVEPFDPGYIRLVDEARARVTGDAPPGESSPLPDSPDEIVWQNDLRFFVSLGPERAAVPCRATGCEHGAVLLSALCRKHHFESIRGRACPFDVPPSARGSL